jgi:hypothetical protein
MLVQLTYQQIIDRIDQLQDKLADIDGQISEVWQSSGRAYENGDVLLIPYENNNIIDDLYAEREAVENEIENYEQMEAID